MSVVYILLNNTDLYKYIVQLQLYKKIKSTIRI